MRSPSWLCVVCAAGAAVLSAGVSRAQAIDPSEFASRSLARAVIMDLRVIDQPSLDDYWIAERVLARAAALDPDNLDLTRRRLQAAYAAGDEPATLALTKDLLRADPTDTVAQLRLVSSQIQRLQTAEQRLEAYQRILGPGGRAIDPAVRSRVALDCAMLHRERGEEGEFARVLAEAMRLDPSNKEAAALAWTHFGQMMPVGPDRLELLINLLMADPLDPNVHRFLAMDLARAGAFEQASRFHRLAVRLFNLSGTPAGNQMLVEGVVIRWQNEGAQVVVDTINQELAGLRSNAAKQITAYERALMPTDHLTKPEQIRLYAEFDQVRLVAAMMAGDSQTVEAAAFDLAAGLREKFEQAAEAAKQHPNDPQAQVSIGMQMWAQILEHVVALAWADMRSELLPDWARSAAGVFGEQAPVARILAAWAELRLGDPAKALERFDALPTRAPIDEVARVISLEKLGRTDEALEVLRDLASANPLSLAGVWARDRHRVLSGVDPMSTPQQEALSRMAAAIPPWVDRMVDDPRNFMGLRVDIAPITAKALEPFILSVRLINTAPIPLGLGADRTINSKLLVAPRLEMGLSQFFEAGTPEVDELDRRLRLMPGETLVAHLWADPGFGGFMGEVGGLETVRLRWRVLQGYTVDNRGTFIPGAACLEVPTESVERTPLPLGPAPAEECLALLASASAEELPGVLAAIRSRMLVNTTDPRAIQPDDVRRAADLAAERYDHADPVVRTMLLAVLPHSRMCPGMEAFDERARRETDPDLLPIVLFTRVSDATDPLLDRCEASESAEVRRFASAMRSRLRTGTVCYSRAGPGVTGLSRDLPSVLPGAVDAPPEGAPPVAPPTSPPTPPPTIPTETPPVPEGQPTRRP